MVKSKRKLKQQQANMQSDAMETAGWSEGLTMGGGDTITDIAGDSLTFSFGDIDMFMPEDEMREKYPALKQAHEHYKSVLEICKTKEKEENEN